MNESLVGVGTVVTLTTANGHQSVGDVSLPAKKKGRQTMARKKWPKEGTDCKTMIDMSHSLSFLHH